MAFALLIIGAALLISAAKGTTDGSTGLFALLTNDFTGPTNFIYWMVAILIIGAIGYIPKIKPVSDAMLGLVILVLFLSKGDPSQAGGGFFEKFTQGLATTTTAPPIVAAGAPGAAAAPGATNPGGTATAPVGPSSPNFASLLKLTPLNDYLT